MSDTVRLNMAKVTDSRNALGLSLRATFKPSSVSGDKRTAEVVWTTGAPVLRRDWDGSYLEELSLDPAHVRMDRLNNGAPFLADHDGSSVRSQLGVVESARLDGTQGIATVRFPTEGISPEADQTFRLIQDGIVQNISVGYRVHKFEKRDGTDPKVPVYRATDWEPFEISAVAMGADDGAGFRSLTRGSQPQQEQQEMSKEDVKAAEAVDVKAETERAVKAERERVSTIQSLVRRSKLGDEFANKMISEGADLDTVRAAMLDKMVERTEATPIQAHSPVASVMVDEKDKTLRAAVSGFMHRHGMDAMVTEMQKRKDPRFADIDVGGGGEFRGMRPSKMAEVLLHKAGVDTRGMSDDGIVGRALTFTRATGEQTASDFAVLLENVMYKTLLGNYLLADDTWRKFCATTTVQDFRPSNRYRTGSFGVLDTVPEGGEFKTKAIPDGLKRQVSVATKGNVLALSRQALVNDDMGALMDTAGKFGRAAGLSIEVDVYALLTANSGLGATFGSTPFFDDTNGNINDTGSALSVQGIDADRTTLALQKDISANEYLNLDRDGALTLLVPVSLRGQALNINKSEWDVSQSSKFQVPNIVQGLFKQVVASPRISGTRRYIFADPGDAAAIMVAFLNGDQAPFMEQRLGWRVDGTEWKLRMDYGVQFFDPKGAVTNAGA